ncbi:hypothetical protein LZ30DRAFT_704262 [Colletotrichum cereale]|nr:hypothetical protein LZ30DRAFT_704262 [Colletotrichum cereale]
MVAPYEPFISSSNPPPERLKRSDHRLIQSRHFQGYSIGGSSRAYQEPKPHRTPNTHARLYDPCSWPNTYTPPECKLRPVNPEALSFAPDTCGVVNLHWSDPPQLHHHTPDLFGARHRPKHRNSPSQCADPEAPSQTAQDFMMYDSTADTKCYDGTASQC